MRALQAEEGYRSGLTSELTFAVTVWALLIATLASPVAFRRSIRVHGSDINAEPGGVAIELGHGNVGSTTASALRQRQHEAPAALPPGAEL